MNDNDVHDKAMRERRLRDKDFQEKISLEEDPHTLDPQNGEVFAQPGHPEMFASSALSPSPIRVEYLATGVPGLLDPGALDCIKEV